MMLLYLLITSFFEIGLKITKKTNTLPQISVESPKSTFRSDHLPYYGLPDHPVFKSIGYGV